MHGLGNIKSTVLKTLTGSHTVSGLGVVAELGKPYIKLEFDDNEALVDFQKRIQPSGEAEPVEFRDGEFYPLEGVKNFKSIKDLEEFFETNAAPFREVKLNIWNVNKEFPDVLELKTKTGKPSCVHIVETPLKYLFLRDSQFTKMLEKPDKRARFFGLVKPTLRFPLLIIEDEKGNLIFIKSFINKDGERIVNMCSVSGNDDFIRTNSEKTVSTIFNIIKTGGTLTRVYGLNTQLNGAGSNVPFMVVEYRFLDDKNKIKFSDNQIFNKNLDGLGAPGDTYIVTDTRKNPRKDLQDTAIFKKFNVEKYTDSGDGWEQVKLIDIKTISKDPARFQNRDTAESSESVNRIIKDVYEGKFDWAKFDPIVVWRDPERKKLFVLSGHSRTKAFEELSKSGAKVDGKDFTKIPAKLFLGDESAAIDFALNSNTLSTKETDIERANYYRQRRKNGTPEAEIIEEVKNNEGKNWTRIWAFSHLLKDGFTNSALKATQNTSTENAELVKIVAEWIGKIFAKYPYLTPEHDKEIYKYLVNEGAYGKGAGKVNNYQKLLEKITKAIERRTQWGKFDTAARLNLWNLNESTNNLRVYDEKKANLSAELRAAINELNQKRKTFFQRAKLDKTITTAQINAALKPYQDNVNLLQAKLIELENNKSQYTDADRRQQALTFEGLTVNDQPAAVFNCPEAFLQTKGFIPTYTRLEDYSALIEPATGEKKLVGYGFEAATLDQLKNACKNYQQVAKLAAHLKGDTELQSAFNVWHWLHTNIKYNYDAPGQEEIRTPARTFADRESGVDCDCLAVFAACLLGAMGYKPRFEIVAFGNSPKFSHIYVNLNGAAVDRVLPVFLARPAGITKNKIMEIPVFELSGGGAMEAAATLNGIYESALAKVYAHEATAEDSADLRKSQILMTLQNSDPQAYRLAAILMPHVVAIDDDGAWYFADAKVAEIADKADKKLYELKISEVNENIFNDFFNELLNDFRNISVKVERGSGTTVLTISFNNPADDAVTITGDYVKKDFIALNPNFLTMRESLKNLLAVNYLGLASKYAVGLMTEQEAVAAGYSVETWKKAVKAFETLTRFWILIGGKAENIADIILNGSEKEPLTDKNINYEANIVATSDTDSILSGCKKRGLSGLNGLGETPTVASDIENLGEEGLEKILDWCSDIETEEEKAAENSDENPVNVLAENATPAAPASSAPAATGEKKKSLIWWLLGGAALGGGIAAATGGKKNKRRK